MNRVLIAGWLLACCTGAAAADALDEGCVAIDSDAERLVCYDRLHGRPLMNDSPRAVVVAPAPVSAPTAKVSTEGLFGKRVEEQNVALERSLNAKHLESLDAEIEHVETNRVGKMSIRLTNGQLWRQIDSKRLRLEAGDQVVIERAAMSSYLLQKRAGSSRIRVKRVD